MAMGIFIMKQKVESGAKMFMLSREVGRKVFKVMKSSETMPNPVTRIVDMGTWSRIFSNLYLDSIYNNFSTTPTACKSLDKT